MDMAHIERRRVHDTDASITEPAKWQRGGLLVVSHSEQVLTVQVDGRPFELHAMWLRDACSCSRCRNPSSSERLMDATSIEPHIGVRAADLREGVLRVDVSDGHLVHLDQSWLIGHLTSKDVSDDPAAGLSLWDATTPGAILSSRFDEVRDLPEVRVGWIDLLHERGIAATDQHSQGEEGVREAASLIGPVRTTNYGEVWTVDATVDPVTAVDSERALRVHTDLPYRNAAPGVQIMMVDSGGVGGGVSTFVDGFAVAEHIRTIDPAAWRLLTSTDFSYPFVRADIEMHGRSPLIGLHTNGSYAEVRRAPDLIGVPFVDVADTAELYRAVRLWHELLDGGLFEQRANPRSGEAIVWNNHRVLHGRTAFTLGTHGRRVLHGGYVDIDDLHSARALAHRNAAN